MNKQRRKILGEAIDSISEVQKLLSSVKDDEQSSYDNLPDSLQYGERGEALQNNIEMLDETDNYLDDAISVLEQI